jgi:hypothetical protein
MMKIKTLLFFNAFFIYLSAMEQNEKCCAICLDDLYGSNQDVITLACHKTHKFHIDCMHGWNKKHPSCPICRVKTVSNEKDPTRFANYTLPAEEKTEEQCHTGCLAALGVQLFISIAHN